MINIFGYQIPLWILGLGALIGVIAVLAILMVMKDKLSNKVVARNNLPKLLLVVGLFMMLIPAVNIAGPLNAVMAEALQKLYVEPWIWNWLGFGLMVFSVGAILINYQIKKGK